ncbi:MAG: hypothetical protein AcusKO_19710 [Acuticoccus sp.]
MDMTGSGGTGGDTPLSRGEARTATAGRRRRQRRAFLLVLPLLVFVAFAFMAPIGSMLYRSAYNPTVANLIPDTLNALSDWDGEALPAPPRRTAITAAMAGETG